MKAVLVAALLCPLSPLFLRAQSLTARLASVPDGTVRFSFAARPGVCGNGGNINYRQEDDWESDCDDGPVRVALGVRAGTVTSVRSYVGGRWRTGASGADWGTVGARAAAEFLLTIARAASADFGEKAILPAVLADSVEVWPDLLALARDRSVRLAVRKRAVFWLGQAAGDRVTGSLDSLIQDPGEREIQEQAVFALSQRPAGEGVPALVRIARSHGDPAVRKKALFWLGQSDDPRAIALFEELLLRR